MTNWYLWMFFFIALLTNDWGSLKYIGSPASQFAARLTFGLLNAYVLNASFVPLLTIWPHRHHDQVLLRDVKIQPVLPFNSTDLFFSANLCFVNTHLAKANTNTNTYHMRLLGVTWNCIVHSKKFRWLTYRGQAKKTCCAVSLSLWHSVHALSTLRQYL